MSPDLDGLAFEYIEYSVGESGQLDVWEYFRLGRPAVQEQNQMWTLVVYMTNLGCIVQLFMLIFYLNETSEFTCKEF